MRTFMALTLSGVVAVMGAVVPACDSPEADDALSDGGGDEDDDRTAVAGVIEIGVGTYGGEGPAAEICPTSGDSDCFDVWVIGAAKVKSRYYYAIRTASQDDHVSYMQLYDHALLKINGKPEVLTTSEDQDAYDKLSVEISGASSPGVELEAFAAVTYAWRCEAYGGGKTCLNNPVKFMKCANGNGGQACWKLIGGKAQVQLAN